MIVAGIDAGLQYAKVAILRESKILSSVVAPAGREATATVASRLLQEAADRAGISPEEIECVAATGTANSYVHFANEHFPEFLCLAKGINLVSPSVRTALDIGAHKTLAVRCANGKPISYATNDRCASGSGRYLEMVSKILQTNVEEMADLALRSKEHVEVINTCAIFAETEIVSLMHMKKKPEDIIRGVLKGVAERAYAVLAKSGLEKEVALVGGVAKNKGVVLAMEKLLGYHVQVPDNPERINAVGAALVAQEQKRGIA